MSIDALQEAIYDVTAKLIGEKIESPQVDALRAVLWYSNAALTLKSVSPTQRTALGAVPITTSRLSQEINKADAPYIDLLWLGHKHPQHLPKRWAGVRSLLYTATMTADIEHKKDSEDIVFATSMQGIKTLDFAFDGADALISRKINIAEKCRLLKLPVWVQAEMRWLCSTTSKQLVKEIHTKESEMIHKMRKSRIKQLTPKIIEQRALVFRAWKLAGGGSKWQATADAYLGMTGKKMSRQGVRDLLLRMNEQKFIRMRRGRKITEQPLLSDDK